MFCFDAQEGLPETNGDGIRRRCGRAGSEQLIRPWLRWVSWIEYRQSLNSISDVPTKVSSVAWFNSDFDEKLNSRVNQ